MFVLLFVPYALSQTLGTLDCSLQLAQSCGKVLLRFDGVFLEDWTAGFPTDVNAPCDFNGIGGLPRDDVPPRPETCAKAFIQLAGANIKVAELGNASLSFCSLPPNLGCVREVKPVWLCYDESAVPSRICCPIRRGRLLNGARNISNLCAPTTTTIRTTAIAAANQTIGRLTGAELQTRSRSTPSTATNNSAPTATTALEAPATTAATATMPMATDGSALSATTIAAIAGGAGGAVLLLLCVLAAVLISRRRRARKQSKSEPERANANEIQMRYSEGPPEHTYSDPSSVRHAPDYVLPRPPQSSYAVTSTKQTTLYSSFSTTRCEL
jgi:hypothetical protein